MNVEICYSTILHTRLSYDGTVRYMYKYWQSYNHYSCIVKSL